jgi:hypothetical protein
MPKLFSIQHKSFLKQVNKSESELNKFLVENWTHFFPQYQFISCEFKLEGNVRSKGTSGRIDILSFNPKSKKFVVFELKKELNRNVNEQASDYRDFIEDNFSDIYLQATQKFNIELPKYTEVSKESVEVVVMSQEFSQTDIDRAKKRMGSIILIKYFWFENDLFFYDYLNGDPDDLIEKENTEKIKKITKVINGQPIISESDIYFGSKEASKKIFVIFYDYLKTKGDVQIKVHSTKISVKTNNETFSVIGHNGKSGRKCLLQINTNFDLVNNSNLITEDRKRANGTKKGSLGNERFEIFIQNEFQIDMFIREIDKLF